MRALRLRGASLRRKLMVVLMVTTAAALLTSATALMIYELRLYRASWIDELNTQANLIAYSAAPALAFDDAKMANQSLSSLRVHPRIAAAAVYRGDGGTLFAAYSAEHANEKPRYPTQPLAEGHRFAGSDIELFRPIEHNGDMLGTVYLRARYDIFDRLKDYLAIVAAVTVLSLGLAALIFHRLQHAVTGPILAVTQVAQEVIEQRNYSLHVPKTTDDEVGVLVDAFNNMLAEVKRRTEALQRADRRKDEFLATLAHELRNPLAPLTTALEILKRADTDPAARQRARDIMERQVRQMARLIDDLLEVSRINTGKLELRRQPLELIAVLRNAIEIAEPALRAREHALETHFPPLPLWVDGDPTRLSQVFANLLSNAAKYTDPGGHVRVEVEAVAGDVTVRVSDDGIGIDPSQQDSIFEMFRQVDQTLEGRRAGLGVGLTLARQLVELHGGTIAVASEGLGRGAQFSVLLPLGQAPPALADAPLADTTALQPLRVLIADDNVDFASTLAAMLRAHGHDVQVVHDGQAALDAALAGRPQVGLFDIGMPGLNGYDLARRLRAHHGTRGMRLVAINGWGQDGDRARSRAAGFDRHLMKPVQTEQVLDALRGATEPLPATAPC